MNLYEMLPLLEGWEYKLNDWNSEEDNATARDIAPGQRFKVAEETGPGFLVAAVGSMNYVYAELEVLANKQRLRVAVSPFRLLGAAASAPTNQGLFLTHYSRIPIPGRITSASALVARTLGTVSLPLDGTITVKALASNAGPVYLSVLQAGTLLATTRWTLAKGESVDLNGVQNLGHIWMLAAVGDSVDILYDAADTLNADASYTVQYQPSIPLPFKDDVQVQIFNPPLLPAQAGGDRNTTHTLITGWLIVYVRIFDVKKFRNSIRELIGAEPVGIGALSGMR